MNITPHIRQVSRGIAMAGGVAGAGAAGFMGSHAATNRGDYQNPGKWTVAAVATGIGAAAVGTIAARHGIGLITKSLDDVPRLATELQEAAQATALAAGAKKPVAAEKLAVAAQNIDDHVAANGSRMAVGTGLLAGTVALGAGTTTGIMMTNARLNPGVLKVEISGEVELDEPTFVERSEDEIGDLGRKADEARRGFGGWLQDVNPFGG